MSESLEGLVRCCTFKDCRCREIPGGVSLEFKCSRCKEHRCQHYAPHGVPGGITVAEAELLGWRLMGKQWVCPFCTGNTTNLKKLFNKDQA